MAACCKETELSVRRACKHYFQVLAYVVNRNTLQSLAAVYDVIMSATFCDSNVLTGVCLLAGLLTQLLVHFFKEISRIGRLGSKDEFGKFGKVKVMDGPLAVCLITLWLSMCCTKCHLVNIVFKYLDLNASSDIC